MQRYDSLDGLRAFAALLVVAFHCWLPFFKGGFIGVDIFFVLSGFLITTLLLTEREQDGKIDLPRFWLRRLVRLYPALLLMLAVFWITAPYLFPTARATAEVIVSALYLMDYSTLILQQPKYLVHTWSLAVEMHFYLLWPFVILLLGRLEPLKAGSLLAILYVLITCWRTVLFDDQDWPRTYYAFDTHTTGLVLGSILALIKWRPTAADANKLGAIALGAILILASHVPFRSFAGASWGGVLAEVSAAALILALLAPGSKIGAAFANPVLVRLGLWSYGLYLWHYPIAKLARDSFAAPMAFLITAGLGLLLAALSYELYEKRIQQWYRGKQVAARSVGVATN